MDPQSQRGFDVGAGNALLDAWVEKHQGKRFDAAGAWARTGKVLNDLWQRLCANPYFKWEPPKSTGRDYFTLHRLQACLRGDERPQDVQRTLVEWVTWGIEEALHRTPAIRRVMLVGGGAKNDFLVERLRQRATEFEFIAAPLPVDVWEAAGFAWLAAQCLAAQALDLRAGKNAFWGRFIPPKALPKP